MEFKDYYDILGVKPEADAAAIKSAYRKLARKYHPDVSKEAGAEDKFKSVNEAYEVLKDTEKRRAYDQVRAGGYRGGDAFRPPPDWSQEFDFGSGRGQPADDAVFSDFFETLFGARAAASRRGHAQRRGRDVHARIGISLATAYAGGRTRVALQDAVRGERTLDVSIPAGIESGKSIRLAGQGEAGIGGGPAGDLLLEVDVQAQPPFRLEGRDVHLVLPLAPWEAALGAKVAVPTLGGEVQMNIPASSQHGRTLRLKGRGLPGKPPGDQLVMLEVALPTATSDADKAAFEAFREAFPGFNARAEWKTA
ncbi:MAG TPA: DnaJ C-terminal domain-containing protein [Rhodanobacteraceae bacterium]|nr:DnaJ C-terminal domain-containing protein [Rhodanobacteraceae bacterium]